MKKWLILLMMIKVSCSMGQTIDSVKVHAIPINASTGFVYNDCEALIKATYKTPKSSFYGYYKVREYFIGSKWKVLFKYLLEKYGDSNEDASPRVVIIYYVDNKTFKYCIGRTYLTLDTLGGNDKVLQKEILKLLPFIILELHLIK